MTHHTPRTAFIGGGMVAEVHRRALEETGALDYAGLFDPDANVAARRHKEWGGKRYVDLDDVFRDPAVDAVHVLTPAEFHVPVAESAMRSGKHTFVEKPVGDQSGIGRLEEVARQTGLVCMPGHNYAYQPEYQRLCRLLSDRERPLGTVRAIWVTYCIQHPESIAKKYGGVLEEVMVHHSYLVAGLAGRPSAVLAGTDGSGWSNHPAEDQAWMIWRYPANLSAHLFASFAVDDPTTTSTMFSVKVLGTDGGSSYQWADSTFRRALGSLTFGIPAYEETYLTENRAFAAACHGDPDAIVSPLNHAFIAAEVAEAAKTSVATDAFVSMGPQR